MDEGESAVAGPARRTSSTTAPKPKRIWVLQAIVGIQLIGAALGVADALMSGLPRLSTGELVLGFAKPVLAFVLLPVLLLSLQRRLPRPDRVAPYLALAWALLTVGIWLTAAPKPMPPALDGLRFDDVAPPATRISNLTMRAAALGAIAWLIASLFIHRPTRAYLRGDEQDSQP